MAEEIKVNKLFLIGNGFDLALDMKTKYGDFLLWLMKNEFIKAIISSSIIPAENKDQTTLEEHYRKINYKGSSSNDLFYLQFEKSPYFSLERNNYSDFNKHNKIRITARNRAGIIDAILKSENINWVDIEAIYFDIIKKTIKKFKNPLNQSIKEQASRELDSLNKELSIITDYLIEYLKELNLELKPNEADNYLAQFKTPVKESELIEYSYKKNYLVQDSYYFLNFNYTNFLSKILYDRKYLKSKYVKLTSSLINQIHGTLENRESIIFGFGDEMDPTYKEIEELNDNRFFEHIKSFKYFQNSQQRELQTFLKSGIYQVCIYGHSCGLSDRVMLNEIFEHENCKSIKIYYYDDADFVNKTMEISRHFNNKQEMRKKIVEKSADCRIPQVKEMRDSN